MTRARRCALDATNTTCPTLQGRRGHRSSDHRLLHVVSIELIARESRFTPRINLQVMFRGPTYQRPRPRTGDEVLCAKLNPVSYKTRETVLLRGLCPCLACLALRYATRPSHHDSAAPAAYHRALDVDPIVFGQQKSRQGRTSVEGVVGRSTRHSVAGGYRLPSFAQPSRPAHFGAQINESGSLLLHRK